MIEDVYSEIKGFFSSEFLLAVYFPVLIFLGVSGLLAVEITAGLGSAAAAWGAATLESQGLSLAALLVFTAVVAYFIHNFQYALTQLYEGYGPALPGIDRLHARQARYHQARWEWLQDRWRQTTDPGEKRRIDRELLVFYPPPRPENRVRIMPTRLGNILRAAEIYPADRYNIVSTVIWTRLHPLLPPEALGALVEKKIGLNLMLLLATLAGLFSLIWCPILLLATDRADLFLLSALGWPLAWFAYHNAVQSAVAYGEQVKAIFDLHRHRLLDALGRPVPPTLDEERIEWERLSYFFYRDVPLPPPGGRAPSA